ncbi:MAG: DUF167 domain-containing protein [Thermodesulfobacteriota bacterium]
MMEKKTDNVLLVSFGSDEVRFQVRVQPRSSSNKDCGTMDGALRVKLTAPPVSGKANRALQEFLAQLLDVPRSAVEIVTGGTSRLKKVSVKGLGPGELERRFEAKGVHLECRSQTVGEKQ